MGILTYMFNYVKGRAVFHDDSGEFVALHYFPRLAKKFRYKKKSYLISTDCTRRRIKRFLTDIDEIPYNLDSPIPIRLEKEKEYVKTKKGLVRLINSEELDAMLETKLAKDLNNVGKTTLADLFTTKNMIIAGIVIGVIYFFTNGGLGGLLSPR